MAFTDLTIHEPYLHRCLQLARQAAGHTAPNPLVGAVLVHQGRIIGEGFHRQYGGPHAEVNCIQSVTEADAHLVPGSTMYVSLEPCAHFGKTPPVPISSFVTAFPTLSSVAAIHL
ncbi:bifunctional diaminohydroxyphosphoribosylaminopyrimidine deaminase/5-amino-6-(5-phosphoribosylamino)uracil reductase RibD [Paraflavitalea speifideaquila]|uniref:bifunctional diaminohydroxyphosphoribosylaminopyrimidine deaminase/5-amino-6-(5-phosphoribosylamino)uracil reductase RibD n=1 Tax=Paraflavitalea speifideaquila TaxID=3076558 RepID=UPI0028E48FA8|nr:deaminase [Paraflavitalea speifideiaquila]